MIPENEAIADAIGEVLSPLGDQLNEVERALMSLPTPPQTPRALDRLRKASADCVRERHVEPRVLQIKRHLAALNEGVGLLNAYRYELTPQAITQVKQAHEVHAHHLEQLFKVGPADAHLQDLGTKLREQLEQERPWRDISSFEHDVQTIKQKYAQVRGKLLANQQELANAASSRVNRLPGFSQLSPDEQHKVLHVIQRSITETDAESIAPSLTSLSQGCKERIEAAERQAIALFDQIAAQKSNDIVVRVSLPLRNREIRNHQDVDALLDEIRTRLLEQLDKNERVRIRLD